MKKIALTGNMGSGKSYVGHLIAGFGVFVLDMDEVGKQIRTEHESELLAMFSIKHSEKLANLVFEQPNKKVQLENFLYPYMLKKMHDFFKEHSEETICIVEVPLLFEKEWEVYFDEVWCVSCTKEMSLKRLLKYRQISKEQADERLRHQMDMQEKEQRSNHVIYNNEGDDVSEQVKVLLEMEGYHVKEG